MVVGVTLQPGDVSAHSGVHSNEPALQTQCAAMQVAALPQVAVPVAPHGISQPVGIGPVQPGAPHSAVQQPGSLGRQPLAQSSPR